MRRMSGSERGGFGLAGHGVFNQEEPGGVDGVVVAAEDVRPDNHGGHPFLHQF